MSQWIIPWVTKKFPQEVQKIPSSDQENLGLIQFEDMASVGQSKNNNMESYFLTIMVSLSVASTSPNI